MKRSTIITWSMLAGIFVLFQVTTFGFTWYKHTKNVTAPIDDIQCSSEDKPIKLHIHAHLTIFVNGQEAVIPKGVGIRENKNCLYWLHTHANTGVIHVESPVIKTFTLGNFFDIWGKTLSEVQIEQYSDKPNKLEVYVNGERYTGDPRDIKLKSHEQIVIEVGPKLVPLTPYTWPANLMQ